MPNPTPEELTTAQRIIDDWTFCWSSNDEAEVDFFSQTTMFAERGCYGGCFT